MSNQPNVKKIHIGADHAGYEIKNELVLFLEQKGFEVIDYGAYEYDADDDYPNFVAPVTKEVSLDPESVGIILGGSGQGEAMLANRLPGVRATVYYGRCEADDSEEGLNVLTLSRLHNDANILSLGARFMTSEEAKEAVELWLETAFSGEERYIRRIEDSDQTF